MSRPLIIFLAHCMLFAILLPILQSLKSPPLPPGPGHSQRQSKNVKKQTFLQKYFYKDKSIYKIINIF